MGRVYRNPPMVEALCEFQFDRDTPWDVTVFGNYYNRISTDFPEKRELSQVEFAVQQNETALAGEMRQGGVRMQFLRSDRTALVQLAPHRLIVNQLPPYPSWEKFKELILARLSDYRAVVPEARVHQLILRYINRFTFSVENFTVGTAFAKSEFVPVRLREKGAPFFLRLEMPQSLGSRLMLTLGTLESEPVDQVVVLLDVAALFAHKALDSRGFSVALDEAHECVEEVFESSLTAALRAEFDREV